MTAREAALQYAGGGWSVLPCRDKVPLVRGGVHAAARDPATIDDGTDPLKPCFFCPPHPNPTRVR